MRVFYGQKEVLVKEWRGLSPNESQFIGGTLFVGPGTDIEIVLLRMNLTTADLRWLESLKIEAP
jgi:hypothetical protein